MNYISLTQTGGTGIINNIHDSSGPVGVNIQDSSNNILTISNVGDVSCNVLNCKSLYIANTTSTIFRFVPWIVYQSDTIGTITNVMRIINSSGAIAGYPTAASDSIWSFSYSIIGNTMYVNFHYTASSNGNNNGNNGIYVYSLPSSYVIDTLTLYATPYVGVVNTDFGSQVGNCTLVEYNNSSSLGPVRITELEGKYYLYLMSVTNQYRPQSTSWFSLSSSNLNVTFMASFPIKPNTPA